MVQRQQAGHRAYQRGLAGAVGAEQGDDAAVGYGQADVVEKVPYTQIASLSGQPDVTVPTFPIVAYDAIWLNHKYGPFADRKVRQALNYALDKSAIVKAVYAGKAEVNNSTIAKTKFWSKSVPAYAFDEAKAKQLLAASKYPKGFKLELKVPAGDSVHQSIAVIAKDAWSKLGIDVSISQEETNTLFTEYSKGNYQAAIPLPTLTSDVLVPDELALAWLVWTPGYQSFFTQYKSPTVAGIVKKANTATQESEQAKLWPQAQQVSMTEAPWVPQRMGPAWVGEVERTIALVVLVGAAGAVYFAVILATGAYTLTDLKRNALRR